jgi:hypothetical protein
MQPNITKRRKEDALALALLLYDIFKENKVSGKIDSGQNNANHPKND